MEEAVRRMDPEQEPGSVYRAPSTEVREFLDAVPDPDEETYSVEGAPDESLPQEEQEQDEMDASVNESNTAIAPTTKMKVNKVVRIVSIDRTHLIDRKKLLEGSEVDAPEATVGVVMDGRGLQGVLAAEVLDFEHLEYMDVGDNQLPFSSLWVFRNLVELHLYCNGISSLEGPSDAPVSLVRRECFQKLETLNLSYNVLEETKLTPLSFLPSLTALDLSYNSLKRLPRCLTSLSQLERIALEGNRLSSSVDLEVLGQLPRLLEVNLSKNRYSYFSVNAPGPQPVTESESLSVIQYSEDDVTSIASDLLAAARGPRVAERQLRRKLFPKLKGLSLADNYFVDFDGLRDALSKMRKLRVLVVHGCPIVTRASHGLGKLREYCQEKGVSCVEEPNIMPRTSAADVSTLAGGVGAPILPKSYFYPKNITAVDEVPLSHTYYKNTSVNGYFRRRKLDGESVKEKRRLYRESLKRMDPIGFKLRPSSAKSIGSMSILSLDQMTAKYFARPDRLAIPPISTSRSIFLMDSGRDSPSNHEGSEHEDDEGEGGRQSRIQRKLTIELPTSLTRTGTETSGSFFVTETGRMDGSGTDRSTALRTLYGQLDHVHDFGDIENLGEVLDVILDSSDEDRNPPHSSITTTGSRRPLYGHKHSSSGFGERSRSVPKALRGAGRTSAAAAPAASAPVQSGFRGRRRLRSNSYERQLVPGSRNQPNATAQLRDAMHTLRTMVQLPITGISAPD